MERKNHNQFKPSPLTKHKPKNKKSFLYNFLNGFALIMPFHTRSYSHPTGGGFKADAQAMKKDFGNIALDMRKTLAKYEQNQTN